MSDIAQLILIFTRKRILFIGDGENHFSMTHMAEVGVGIVEKEGHRASLTGDFRIEKVCHLTKLVI